MVKRIDIGTYSEAVNVARLKQSVPGAWGGQGDVLTLTLHPIHCQVHLTPTRWGGVLTGLY